MKISSENSLAPQMPSQSPMNPLPIDEHLPALIAALQNNPCAVLRAETGAGKTTRVPPALLDAALAGEKQIILLQPRRLAARAAAARMSQQRKTPLGELIGYEVRFDRRASRATRILAVTDGIFVRMLQADPLLERVGIVVFDEFHERSLNSDLALAMVRRVQQLLRPDLKIIVMSATLAAEPIAQFLGNCPTIDSPGRLFPIEIQHVPHSSTEPVHIQAAQAAAELLERTARDILVFLPGVGEIRRTTEQLSPLAAEQNLTLVQLYGDMPLAQQQAVLAPAQRRRIVLATNVAQTSLTIEGITAVIDSGLARVLRRDASLGLNRLEIERISRASADQRAGRAGRTAPGICLRLWTAAQHRHLPEHDEPEIQRVDLAGAILELLAWGEPDPLALSWFQPPSAAAVEQSLILLRTLGAVEADRITPLGIAMARLPVHPRIARLMLAGARLRYPAEAALAGAMLSERNIFGRSNSESGKNKIRNSYRHGSDSDVLDRLAALVEFEQTGRRDFELGSISPASAQFVLKSRDQLLRLLEEHGSGTTVGEQGPAGEQKKESEIEMTNNEAITADEAILRAVAVAYSDRLARRREPDSRRGLMLGGRGVRLLESSAVTQAELFVCVELEEAGDAEALVRLASAVEAQWLPAAFLATSTEVQFDVQRQRVMAWRRTCFRDLVIDESATNIPPDVDVSDILVREAAARLDLSSLLSDEARQFMVRVQCLSQWMPELGLPTWDSELTRQLLPDLCDGRTSFAQLKEAPALAIIQSKLNSQQLAAIAREVPERISVPSGSRITLEYELGKPPILAVRIQELFGLAETPRIAGGRVPVVLHLLGPNYRPQQVTTDLASFWRTAYAQVRKEMRRRYPKHSWPEDPLSAPAVRRGPSSKR